MGRQYIGIEQMDYIEDIAVKRMQKVIGTTVRKDGELLNLIFQNLFYRLKVFHFQHHNLKKRVW
jgi:adenine specific DNA methylase Mod